MALRSTRQFSVHGHLSFLASAIHQPVRRLNPLLGGKDDLPLFDRGKFVGGPVGYFAREGIPLWVVPDPPEDKPGRPEENGGKGVCFPLRKARVVGFVRRVG